MLLFRQFYILAVNLWQQTWKDDWGTCSCRAQRCQESLHLAEFISVSLWQAECHLLFFSERGLEVSYPFLTACSPSSSTLPLTPAKLDELDTFSRYTPTFKALHCWHGLIHVSLQLLRVQWHKRSLTPRRVGILVGLRFCTAQKAGCVPPGAAGQSHVDVSLWGMSQQQSWRQHCPVWRLVHSPWEVHSGYQSCSSSIFTASTSIMRGLWHIVRGSWGLEITVAARVAHILSGWIWCPWLGEDGCFTRVWEKID